MSQGPEADKQEILKKSPFTRALMAQSPLEMRKFEPEYMEAIQSLERNFERNLGRNWRRIHLPTLLFVEAGFEALQMVDDSDDLEEREAYITYMLFSGCELGMDNIDLFVEDVEDGLRNMNALNSAPRIMGGGERITDGIRTIMKIGANFGRYLPNTGGPIPTPEELRNP